MPGVPSSSAGGFTVSREAIIAVLRGAMEARPEVCAMFLAGSDATGRTDAGSDVDACVIAADEAVESTLEAASLALGALAPIASRYRLPEPTWHGHSQCFYLLEGADPRHMVDLVVMRRSAPDRLLEPERHGTPRVLFDREGLVVPATLDRVGLRERMAAQLDALTARSVIFRALVPKALDRGHVAEAMHFYLGMTWRPLVDVVRMIHCPERFDFGPRYLDRDVPAEWRARIERLALAGSAEELREHHGEAAGLLEALLPEARARVEGCGGS